MRKALRWMPVLLAAMSALLFSQPAYALYYWEMKSLNYRATLTANGQSVTSVAPSTSSTFAPLFQADADLFSTVSTDVNNQVGAILTEEVTGNGGTLQGYSTTLNGPINVNVTPTGALTVSGMSLDIVFYVYQAKFVGPVKVGVVCTFNEAFNTPVVTGGFDINAGTLSTLTVNLGTPVQNVSCNSDLSGVPFLGDMINGEATQYASQAMQKGLAGMTSFNLNSAGGTGSGFGGLATGIPSGVFVVNGLDYGALLRANLPAIIASGGITASFYNPAPYSIVGNVGSAGSNEVYYNQLVVSLPAQNLQFSLIQDALYVGIWRCPYGQSCGSPP